MSCPVRLAVVAAFALLSVQSPASARDIVDSTGRTVAVPDEVSRVICSGAGSLRLLTYLGAQDKVVAVDDMETRRQQFDARPYAMANPQFKSLPVFGEFRGFDRPEQILALDPQPEVILKATVTGTGIDPVDLEKKTGIPVITIDFGDLGKRRDRLYAALRIMAQVVDRKARADEVISFLDQRIADLKQRSDIGAGGGSPTVYIGGVAYKGPHGFQATEPTYPPFDFVGLRNVANSGGGMAKDLAHTDVAKEMIVKWNPEFLFLDLATLQLGDIGGGLSELRTDPSYRSLTAVKEGRVYGLLPYNWYSQNFGSILANAYFIGKLVWPQGFQDIVPASEADAIYTFLVGKPAFKAMNASFRNLAYTPVPLQ
ncbi:iron ABC transporter substrate-binding protein [Shumkonia mesophila]|uniref:iron ABC transporter substrate-binding protein n=1 Tax=Shumkonia mesophila TaxID=2838854 RepID=UPI0029347BA5|nr:iron ABC transporter substrate-binding protein [Shumkonia mesophila]